MMVKVLIKDHVYQMTKKQALGLIKEIKKSRRKTNTILALEKDNIFEMRDDGFKTLPEMLKVVKEYSKQGYLVHKVQK